MTDKDPSRGNTRPFGSLAEAKVVAVEVRLGEDGQPELDAAGNVVPTGLLRVELLDRGEIRENVPYLGPMFGNSAFVGCVPEVGSLCLVGWRAVNRPVVLGSLPFGLDNVTAERGTVPTMEPGEIVVQGSKTDLSENKKRQMFTGPRMWFDRHGRVAVSATDYSLLAGYVLDDDFGPDPQLVDDPEVAEPILFRERIGPTERRITQGGSVVAMVTGQSVERVARDRHTEVGGDYSVLAQNGIRVQDRKRNGLLVTPDDVAQLQANAKARVQSQGDVEIEAHANLSANVLGEIGMMGGTGLTLTTGGSVQLRSLNPAGGVSLSALGGIDMLSALGAKLTALSVAIRAGSGASIAAVLGDIEILPVAGKVALGAPAGLALDPFVLSVELQALLAALVASLLSLATSVTPSPTGGPGVGAAVAALTDLQVLLSQPIAPFASKKVFGV